MSNKLEINGLECIRDNRLIFKDINFSVKSNQTMLVRGKNGSGKTSLLRVLAGYIKNYSGNILFNGPDIFIPYWRIASGPNIWLDLSIAP